MTMDSVFNWRSETVEHPKGQSSPIRVYRYYSNGVATHSVSGSFFQRYGPMIPGSARWRRIIRNEKSGKWPHHTWHPPEYELEYSKE